MTTGTLTSNTSGDWVDLPEGDALLILDGGFGGGTAIVEVQQSDEETAQAVTDASWTADVVRRLSFGGGCRIRVTLSGATTPSLVWEIHPLRSRATDSFVQRRPLVERY